MPFVVDLDKENIEEKIKDIISSTVIHLQGKGPSLYVLLLSYFLPSILKFYS